MPSFVRAVSASSFCSVTERHTVHHVPPRVLTYSLCLVTLFAAYPSSLPPHSPRFLRLSAYVPHRCVPFIQVFFSSLLCLWLCSASQMAGHYCVATFCVSGHIPINYPVCVDPIWTCVCLTLLRVIDTFLVFVLKISVRFRFIFLIAYGRIFLGSAPVYCVVRLTWNGLLSSVIFVRVFMCLLKLTNRKQLFSFHMASLCVLC